jgi:DNA-binding NarL/FixJ family response regulator
LSPREIEILKLLAEGASNRKIAEKLVLAEGTVKNHVSNILSKLHTENRTQAVYLARERKLL